ncbi:MAG: hypothetical protein J1E64_04665 [Acetatifactor sp.]|nr:hypothetical protein [Acetatifactor sp.]
MKNTEHPQRKIKWQQGKVEWTAGLFFLLFLGILLCTQLQIEGYRSTALYLEDALAASNLASAVIDIQEYGISHTVQIADPAAAYVLYEAALKVNLSLNENWECPNRDLISGPVTVEEYIVYNVKDDLVTIYHVGRNGSIWKETGIAGEVRSPDGILIESSSVYSEISFSVEGFLGVTVEARKGKLADIVVNE